MTRLQARIELRNSFLQIMLDGRVPTGNLLRFWKQDWLKYEQDEKVMEEAINHMIARGKIIP